MDGSARHQEVRIPPPDRMSWREVIASTTNSLQKEEFFDALGTDLEHFDSDWFYRLRAEQFAPPGEEWDVWYVNAGRGWGKTQTGAYWVNEQVRNYGCRMGALIGETIGDVRDVMINGPAGIIPTSPRDFIPVYLASNSKVVWPNGAEAHLYSAHSEADAEKLRGPQHDFGWCDEMAKWRYMEHAWDMYQFGLRLGDHPRTLITTTPKPRKALKEIKEDPYTVVTKGITYDNVHNLPPSYKRRLLSKYEGTRLGQQELHAIDLEEAEGALWDRDMLEGTRIQSALSLPDMDRIVVGLDPAVTSDPKKSSEMGVIIGGRVKEHCYILEDLSKVMSVGKVSRLAVEAASLWSADRIIGEVNNGGDWIEHSLRQVDKNVSYKSIRASRGKQTRAEPVASLWEQKRCHMVGYFAELEDQLCSWEPDAGLPSPDRLDAMVWVVTELMLGGGEIRSLQVEGL